MKTNTKTNTAPLVPLSAPVGVSGVTLPDSHKGVACVPAKTCLLAPSESVMTDSLFMPVGGRTYDGFVRSRDKNGMHFHAYGKEWTLNAAGVVCSRTVRDGRNWYQIHGSDWPFAFNEDAAFVETYMPFVNGGAFPSPAEPVAPPASPVDSVGVPAGFVPVEVLGALMDALEREVHIPSKGLPEWNTARRAIALATGERIRQVCAGCGARVEIEQNACASCGRVFADAIPSHAANLAKIKALTEALEKIAGMEPYAGDVMQLVARAALALPSA